MQSILASRWARTAAFALTLTLLASGCGKSKATVSGKVYYQGKPLAGGSVVFASVEGKANDVSQIAPDGSYTVKIPPGKARIAVETKTAQVGKAPPGGVGKMMPPKGVELPAAAKGTMYDQAGKGEKAPVPLVPDRYGDPDQSKLEYDVQSGSQVFDIKLD